MYQYTGYTWTVMSTWESCDWLIDCGLVYTVPGEGSTNVSIPLEGFSPGVYKLELLTQGKHIYRSSTFRKVIQVWTSTCILLFRNEYNYVHWSLTYLDLTIPEYSISVNNIKNMFAFLTTN